MGIICPQSLFPEKKKEPDFQKPGVYVLVGTSDETGNPKIYIGEGDQVSSRLNEHYAKKDFWTKTVVFTSVDNSLHKSYVKYLESRLIALAHEAKQCEVINEKTTALPALPKNDILNAERFLQEMLRCFTAIGVQLFEKPKERVTGDNETKLLYIKSEVLKATGYESANGFVVCKDSQAILDVVESFDKYPQFQKVMRDRTFLIEQSILKREDNVYVFTQDFTLSSASNAANVVLGYSGDLGRWRDEHGTSLKEIRKRESESAS